MPDIQELITKYAQSKSPVDYGEIVKAVQTSNKLWTAYSPVTKCHYTEYIRGIPTAFVFSEKSFCEDFKQHVSKNRVQIETELCKPDKRLQLFSDLYRCGIENVLLDNGKKFTVMSLFDLIDKPDFSSLPENEQPVVNPNLMVGANIFFQNVGAGSVTKSQQKTLLRGLYTAKYLMPVIVDRDTKLDGMEESTLKAVYSQSGTAVTIVAIKTDEKVIIPLFTDWTEFSRFDKDKQCTGNIVTFRDIEYLCGQGETVTVNPFGFNMVIDSNAVSVIKQLSADVQPSSPVYNEVHEEMPVTEQYEEYTETPVEEQYEEYTEAPVEEQYEEYTETPVEEEYEQDYPTEEPVTLFELRSVPNGMIQVLMYYMQNTEGINAAYLKGMAQGDNTSYLVVVDFDGDTAILDDIAEQVQQYSEGVPVYIIPHDSDLGQAAAQSTYPFYQK